MGDIIVTEGKIGKAKHGNLIIPKLGSCLGIIMVYPDNYRIGAHAVVVPDQKSNMLSIDGILNELLKVPSPKKLFVLGHLGIWKYYFDNVKVKVAGIIMNQRKLHGLHSLSTKEVVYEDLETRYGIGQYKLVAKSNSVIEVYKRNPKVIDSKHKLVGTYQ